MPSEALAVVAVGFAAFALAVAVALAVQVGRLRRAYDALVAGDEGATFGDAVARTAGAAQALRTDVHGLRGDVAALRAEARTALRHVAVVRYDAFGDLGGRLSFSAALLDDAGDGVVLTSIHSRSEARSYAKGVSAGASEHELSPEEQEAVAHASRLTGSRR